MDRRRSFDIYVGRARWFCVTASGTDYRHSGRFVRPFARVLRGHTAMPRRVLDAMDAIDADDWIPFALSARFCERAIARTHDLDLGLHAAEAVQPGDFDVVEFAGR